MVMLKAIGVFVGIVLLTEVFVVPLNMADLNFTAVFLFVIGLGTATLVSVRYYRARRPEVAPGSGSPDAN